MDLGLLSYNSKKNSSSTGSGFALGLLCLLTCFFQPSAKVRAEGTNDYTTFATMRDELLKHISGAKQRVWLVSDYITDGEVVGSLHVAKYRKIDVAVLLGRPKLNAYLSRLNYLQKNGIVAGIRPGKFPFNDPTLLLVDKALYKIDSDLNFLTHRGRFRIVAAEPEEADMFIAAFLPAVSETNKTLPMVPMPLESGHNSDKAKVNTSLDSPTGVKAIQPAPSVSYSGDSYNYDYAKKLTGNQPSADTARQLPKQPLYLKNQRQGVEIPVGPSLNPSDRVLNPITAREPSIRSPKSPESN